MATGIEKMIQLAKENQGFKKALQDCKTAEEALSILSEHSISVSSAELTQYTQSTKNELSDTDLDGVSGAGSANVEINIPRPPCFMFG